MDERVASLCLWVMWGGTHKKLLNKLDCCLCLCTEQQFRVSAFLNGDLHGAPVGDSTVILDFKEHVGNDGDT